MKRQIRQEILKKRLILSHDEVALKSKVIIARIQELPEFKQARVVMVYLPFRNEVATETIISTSLQVEKRIIVPVSKPKDRLLIPSEILHFPEDLATGTYGILEPKPEAIRPVDPQLIDLVLVPGVAFDRRGYRLGYGAGYYDRFLSALSPKAVFIAPAYQLQILEDVNPEEHDAAVHLIVTEEQIIDLRN